MGRRRVVEVWRWVVVVVCGVRCECGRAALEIIPRPARCRRSRTDRRPRHIEPRAHTCLLAAAGEGSRRGRREHCPALPSLAEDIPRGRVGRVLVHRGARACGAHQQVIEGRHEVGREPIEDPSAEVERGHLRSGVTRTQLLSRLGVQRKIVKDDEWFGVKYRTGSQPLAEDMVDERGASYAHLPARRIRLTQRELQLGLALAQPLQ